jgi:hypothetical protein
MSRIPSFNLSAGIVPATDRLVPRYFVAQEPADDPLPDYRSKLGALVYSNLQFLETSGTSLDNSLNRGGSNSDNKVLLTIDTVLMAVNQTKNIVKTPIVGRSGTVKEYISDGDFMIDIQGAIVSEYPLVYPESDVKILIELLSLPKQIPVASFFLDRFGIHSIVVESWDVAEKLGSRNEVPFRIQALSDLAEEIILNPNDQI